MTAGYHSLNLKVQAVRTTPWSMEFYNNFLLIRNRSINISQPAYSLLKESKKPPQLSTDRYDKNVRSEVDV